MADYRSWAHEEPSSNEEESSRTFVLWSAVEEFKARETVHWRELMHHVEARLQTDPVLAAAEQEIQKDIKRTFPLLAGYESRESATRNVLLAYAHRNPRVGYCQSLNFVAGVLLLSNLSEQDAFFSLCTLVESVMPIDYYSQELGILGARVDQLVFVDVLKDYLPLVDRHLRVLNCPVSVVSIQWFMCLFAKDLPVALTMRVWDVLFVYGDAALFAVGVSMMSMAEARLLSCTSMESLYEALKTLGDVILSRDHEAGQRLILRSLEVLMRTSLAQYVEIARVKHRLALQQQEIDQLSLRRQKKHSRCEQASSSGAISESHQAVAPQEEVERGAEPPLADASRGYSGEDDGEHVPSRRRFPWHEHAFVDEFVAAHDERFPWQIQHARCASEGEAQPSSYGARSDPLDGAEAGSAAAGGPWIGLGGSFVDEARASRVAPASEQSTTPYVAPHGEAGQPTASAAAASAAPPPAEPEPRPRVGRELLALEGTHRDGGGEARLDALIAFLSRNARLLQQRCGQLRQENKQLRTALDVRGLSLTMPHVPLGASLARQDEDGADAAGAGSCPLRFYDALLDLRTISDVLHGGWVLRLSPPATAATESVDVGRVDGSSADGDGYSAHHTFRRPSNSAVPPAPSIKVSELPQSILDLFPSDTPVIGVLGMFNSGKTFLLNCLCGTSLPSSKRVATRGLSLRRATVASTPVTLIDSEGSLAPVALSHKHALSERHATDELLERLTVRAADYLLYVVEDFTSVDQRAVHRLAGMLRDKSHGFAELVVVHNMRTVTDLSTLHHAWRAQVTSLHGHGEQQEATVLLPAHASKPPVHQQVKWFKTRDTRHVLLAQQVSDAGRDLNAATFALLRMWILSAYVPTTSKHHGKGLLAQLLQTCEQSLEEKLKQKVELLVEPSADPTVRYVRTSLSTLSRAIASPSSNVNGTAIRPGKQPAGAPVQTGKAESGTVEASPSTCEIRAEASGDTTTADTDHDASPNSTKLGRVGEMAQPFMRLISQDDAWQPAIDLCCSQTEFVIVADLPGLKVADLKLSRTGACLLIRGSRRRPYADEIDAVRSECRFGSFEVAVKIPDRYVRKWMSCKLLKGVIRISFPVDNYEEGPRTDVT
ncbi:hypothetical protein AB1Y20_022243 [Prymnesium parvum]|uniref:Uncharacterized protein n=1 Tax=Prymnesium parvum TaxID=97485 RepID=A0AB34JJ13_PRYPA